MLKRGTGMRLKITDVWLTKSRGRWIKVRRGDGVRLIPVEEVCYLTARRGDKSVGVPSTRLAFVPKTTAVDPMRIDPLIEQPAFMFGSLQRSSPLVARSHRIVLFLCGQCTG